MIDQNLQSNLHTPLQTNQFTIEQNAHMFSMLIGKVYNDLILAPVREWSTNAVDAHILANNPDPFVVHLPTSDEPHFSVRDFGPGLSEDDILGLFSSFGSSTKRDSNAYNGQFGIGRMSGLAYATSFTVDSYHNGTHYSYLITLQDGIPVNAKLFDSPTSEPNGLKLTLSVKTSDISDFHQRAQYLYRYFDHKPTLNIDLDISTPVDSKLCDDWYFHNERGSYVLMANVRYVIATSNFKTYGMDHIIFKLPTGSVSITPGRESLSYDEKTQRAIQAAYDNAFDTALSHSQDFLDEQTTPYAQLTLYCNLVNKLPSNVAEQLTITNPTALSYLSHQPRNYRSRYVLPASALFCTIRVKERYRDKTRSHDSIDLCHFNHYTYVLADSVNYSHALSQIAKEHSNSTLAIFTKSTGALSTFLDHTVPILDALGIPYIRTSNYIAPDRVKSDRCGVYYLQYSIHTKTFSTATKAQPDRSYIYVPLSGYDVVPEYRPYLDLYQYFYSNGSYPFKLIGIQQKYLSEAASNPNFTLLDDTFVDTIRAGAPYTISVVCDSSPHCEFSDASLPDNVPAVCKLHQQEIQHHSQLCSSPTYRIPTCKPLFDHFNIPYDFTTTTVTTGMLAPYRLYRNFYNKEAFHYYLQLEHFRELHSNSPSEHPPLHHA